MLIIDPETERMLSARAQQDLRLIQAALQGQPSAYEGLLQRYQRAIYQVVLKMVRNPDDAQDLTQEAFTKAFRHLARYQPQFAFSTWLLRITTNHCIDFLRRKKRVPSQFLPAAFASNEKGSLLPEMRDQALDPQESYIRQQRIELVQRVVARLPPKYATLVRLRYFQELSYEEVALELQLPVGTVKANLFRARALLLELIGSSNAAI